MHILRGICGVIAATMACAGNAATNVDFSASLTTSCTVSITTSGQMTLASDGLSMSSEPSGTAAVVGIVALGALPSVTVGAPTLPSYPSGWNDTSTKFVRYTSTLGANRAYTSSSSSYNMTGLSDVLTLHGKVTNATIFPTGDYTLRTAVTCG